MLALNTGRLNTQEKTDNTYEEECIKDAKSLNRKVAVNPEGHIQEIYGLIRVPEDIMRVNL
jgi:hypothetical protein